MLNAIESCHIARWVSAFKELEFYLNSLDQNCYCKSIDLR